MKISQKFSNKNIDKIFLEAFNVTDRTAENLLFWCGFNLTCPTPDRTKKGEL